MAAEGLEARRLGLGLEWRRLLVRRLVLQRLPVPRSALRPLLGQPLANPPPAPRSAPPRCHPARRSAGPARSARALRLRSAQARLPPLTASPRSDSRPPGLGKPRRLAAPRLHPRSALRLRPVPRLAPLHPPALRLARRPQSARAGASGRSPVQVAGSAPPLREVQQVPSAKQHTRGVETSARRAAVALGRRRRVGLAKPRRVASAKPRLPAGLLSSKPLVTTVARLSDKPRVQQVRLSGNTQDIHMGSGKRRTRRRSGKPPRTRRRSDKRLKTIRPLVAARNRIPRLRR